MAKKSDYSLFINFFFNSLKKKGNSLFFRPSIFTIHYFFGSLFTIHYEKGPLFTNHYTPSRPSYHPQIHLYWGMFSCVARTYCIIKTLTVRLFCVRVIREERQWDINYIRSPICMASFCFAILLCNNMYLQPIRIMLLI